MPAGTSYVRFRRYLEHYATIPDTSVSHMDAVVGHE